MSVAWNDDKRFQIWGFWKCNENDSLKTCPVGTRGDIGKHVSRKTSRCFGAKEESVPCFKNDYNTDDNTMKNCCIGATDPDKCHINFYTGSPECTRRMRNFCVKGNNINNDDACVIWGNRNPIERHNILKSYCNGNNLNSEVCKVWCDKNPNDCAIKISNFCNTTNVGSNQACIDFAVKYGGLDSVVSEFCRLNAENYPEFCSCDSAIRQGSAYEGKDETLKTILSRPDCFLTKCSTGGGYKTANMRNSQTCPNINVCQNTLNTLGNIETNIEGVSQSCDQDQNTTITTTTTTKDENTTSNDLMILIFILLILVPAGMYLILNLLITNEHKKIDS